SDGQLHLAEGLGRVDGTEAVGAGDDDEIAVAEVVGDRPRHAQLAHHLVHRDQGLAADVPAALGQHLVFDVGRRYARRDVELGGPLDVEDVAVPAIHVHDHRWDIEVPRGYTLLRVAHRHGQLELSQRAHGAAGGVGDLDARVEVHVGRAEMADSE